MDQIKKILLFNIPMSICNFRCSYCYLSQREVCYQNIQPEPQYTPEQIAKACSRKRLGGVAYMNFCAEGETLLTKNIDAYIRALVEEGHYAEIVSNMTITPMLDRILAWPRELLKRVEFKCSFHYLELKEKNLLETFADNVKKVWQAGASANIEITPHDELIPHLDELKAFSLAHFGALPHLSIARNDNTKAIDYLTNLPMDEYDAVWSTFGSDFWEFKKSIFGKKQKNFCYAGQWSALIDFYTGEAKSCYCGEGIGNVYVDPESPFPEKPIGRCPIAHCYNGHMLLTLGLIPTATDVRYGEIRNRQRAEGGWLKEELLAFFNSKLSDTNPLLSDKQKKRLMAKARLYTLASFSHRAGRKILRKIKK